MDNYIKILLALTIWREARGEGQEGMRAVAHVIRNRVKTWLKPWHQVITDKNQFTAMSVKGDPNTVLWPTPGDHTFISAQLIADKVYGIREITTDPDPTKGATYYHNARYSTSLWFYKNVVKKRPVTAIIGNHTFYA